MDIIKGGKKMKNKIRIEKINKICFSKKIFLISILLVGGIFLIWNIWTPLVADDFAYAFVDQSMSKRVGSIGDILYSMWLHTHETNGRLIPHAFVELFIWWGKGFFNIVNTIVYIVFGMLIYRFMNQGKKKYNVLLYLGVQASLLLLFPVYGQTMLWLDGACNYLWGITFILAFLSLYFKFYFNQELFRKKYWIVISILLGFFAGGVSENSSAACVAGTFLFLVLYKIKKIRIPKWALCGWIMNLLCWIGLICSPANFLRKQSFNEAEGILEKWLNRFQTCNEHLYKYVLILLVLALVLLVLEYSRHGISEYFVISLLFLIMFFGAHYSMIMVPFYPERAMTGAITFLMISIGILLQRTENYSFRNCIGVIVIFFATLMTVIASGDILVYHRQTKWREEKIIQEKNEGNTEISTYLITPRSKYCAGYGLGEELSEDKEYWKNKYMASYYELDSIVKQSGEE